MAAGGWQINDVTRLRTLRDYGIFSLGPEERYQEVAALAAETLDAPVAFINFIERDRQWFKASHGMAVAEPPIEQSICVHCLEVGGLLVIEDLTTDRRTKDLPLVTRDPAVRFYVGVPIVVDGQGVGVLAVLDLKPRPGGISADQSQELGAYARKIAAFIGGDYPEGNRLAEDDIAYYRDRQRQELSAADNAVEICCRQVHLELARRYALRVEQGLVALAVEAHAPEGIALMPRPRSSPS